MMTTRMQRWIPALLGPFGLIFLVLTLAVITAVDVDGDPATSNVTSIVLADRPTAVEMRAEEDLPAPPDLCGVQTRPRGSLIRLCHWARVLWNSHTHPIRGP
jgi:hypothetical protein